MIVQLNPEQKNQPAIYSCTPSPLTQQDFYYVQHIGQANYDSDFRRKRKATELASFLINFTLRGSGILHYKGDNYQIEAGDICFMDCRVPHEYYTSEGGSWEKQWIHFYGSASERYFQLFYEKYGCVLKAGDFKPYFSCWNQIYQLIQANDLQYELKASSLIVQLLTQLSLNPFPPFKLTDDPYVIIRKALDYIEQHYAKPINVELLANLTTMSKSYFFKTFKSITGHSPYEYVIRQRISKSKYLLGNPLLSLDQISEQVGFESTSNYIHTFRRYENTTPSKYRQLYMLDR